MEKILRGPGNNRNRVVNITSFPSTYQDAVSSANRVDRYRFSISKSSSFNLTLSKLKANADVALLDNQNKVVESSRRSGKSNETIGLSSLDKGTYFIQVSRRSGRTSYQLRLDAKEIVVELHGGDGKNTSPVVPTNKGGAVARGATLAIDSNSLAATDKEQSGEQLSYTLNALPQQGSLQLDGVTLGLGDRFTQADIASGRLSYAIGSNPLIKNLTNSGSTPQISESGVVWAGADPADDVNKIFFYNPATGKAIPLPNSINGSAPQISGSNVTWVASPDGNDTEIFLYDGSIGQTKQLTDNSVTDFNPQISGSNVAWVSNDGNDNEIFIYKLGLDGVFRNFQLTDNATDDSSPQIFGSSLAWNHKNANNTVDIWFHNASSLSKPALTPLQRESEEVIKLTTNANTSGLQVSNEVVWVNSSGGNNQVFYYTGSGLPKQLTSGATDKGSPEISNVGVVNTIAYTGLESGNNKIFYSNVSATPPVSITITPRSPQDTFSDQLPQLSGTSLAWRRFDGSDYEIFYYNAQAEIQPNTSNDLTALTNNNTDDFLLAISGSNVFWSGTDQNTKTSEIFYYDGGQASRLITDSRTTAQRTAQLTNQADGIDTYSLKASGSSAVWLDQNAFGAGGSAIYYTNFARADSFGFTINDGQGGTATGNFNITIS
jgi:hypothetical protein